MRLTSTKNRDVPGEKTVISLTISEGANGYDSGTHRYKGGNRQEDVSDSWHDLDKHVRLLAAIISLYGCSVTLREGISKQFPSDRPMHLR
jgi:hypothetical protein